MENFLKELREIVNKNGKIPQDRQLTKILSKEHIEKIFEITYWVEEKDCKEQPRGLVPRIHLILNNIGKESYKNGICAHKYCDKQTSWKNQKIGFMPYCSYQCGNNSPKHIEVMKSDEMRKKCEGKVGYSTFDDDTKEKRNFKIIESQSNRTEESRDLERQRYKKTWDSKTKEERQKYHINLTQSRLKKYGYEYTWQIPEVRKKIKKIHLENWGFDHPMKSPIIKEKYKNTSLINFNFDHPMQSPFVKEKVRKTHEVNENWITEKKVKGFKDYTKLVWRYTRKQPVHILENIERRGNGKDFYHLDHMYSIFQGFLDKIPAKIVGNICNLKMITDPKNRSKNKKCSISKEKLLEDYKKLGGVC